ncbi:MAG TPA: gamma-glutamyltransferase family protein [Casimicrobiaceae bacterium]|nr:gamma-glutamyltransferase family protein [Casimicrobiaceae bacterium]
MTTLRWDFPYAWQRKPVLAGNVVATSQPLAAQAGMAMLRQGGNAVDAAVATAIALTVVEPTMNGIGGDAFALVWDGTRLHGLNASGCAPHAWTPQRFAGRDAMPTTGWDAVTVPGEVSGWVALSKRFGRLAFADLFAPAIEYARSGFPVSPTVARQWRKDAATLGHFQAFRETFLPRGRAPEAGEWFSCEAQARSLELIAASDGEAFYRGELAENIVADSAAHGGAMSLRDLAHQRAEWVDPVGREYRGCAVHEIPPNGQGVAVHMALGILAHTDIAILEPDSADSLHLQMEALKLAFADLYRHVGDIAAMRTSVDQLLDRDRLARLARKIDMRRAQFPRHDPLPSGDTVYLASADAGGMMVSYIQSNYFPSGIVVPRTGISMQARGAAFSLERGHVNEVGGGKRPFHTIIPAFITRDGGPWLSFGIVGTTLQPQGQVQLIVRMLDHGANPQAACDAPRFRLGNGPDVLVETAFDKPVVDELNRRGHRATYGDVLDFGCAQLVMKLERGYLAASDPRRDGQAAGY